MREIKKTCASWGKYHLNNNSENLKLIKTLAKYLKSTPTAKLEIRGNCGCKINDSWSRKSDEYTTKDAQALMINRATAIFMALWKQEGVNATQLRILQGDSSPGKINVSFTLKIQ